jgi:hypothetical protein
VVLQTQNLQLGGRDPIGHGVCAGDTKAGVAATVASLLALPSGAGAHLEKLLQDNATPSRDQSRIRNEVYDRFRSLSGTARDSSRWGVGLWLLVAKQILGQRAPRIPRPDGMWTVAAMTISRI